MAKRNQTKRAGYKEACELLRRAYKYRNYNLVKLLNDNEAMYYICQGLFKGSVIRGACVSPATATGAQELAIREALRDVFFVLANRGVDFAECDFYELPQVHFENKSMSAICYELSRVLPFNDTPTMRDKLLKIFVRQLFELAFFVGVDVLSVD